MGTVAGELAGVVAGGAAAGATAGGLNAAYYGGNVGQAMLEGAVYGAGSAMVMYGAVKLYGWATSGTPAARTGAGYDVQPTAAQRFRDLPMCVDYGSDPIGNNPRVVEHFNDLWNESLPGNYTKGLSSTHEMGTFIHGGQGGYSYTSWSGTYQSVDWQVGLITPNTVASGHVHPYFYSEALVPSGQPGGGDDFGSFDSLRRNHHIRWHYIVTAHGVIRVDAAAPADWCYTLIQSRY